MKASDIEHRFVEAIPEKLENCVLYVSIDFATVVHMCLCGCGQEVVTPLSPTDWKITFDGETVSLDPSVGNWSFDCQSHYWIRRNKVRWAGQMSEEQIARVRAGDRHIKAKYFGADREPKHQPVTAVHATLLSRFAKWLGIRNL
jgi:hypothetical protein